MKRCIVGIVQYPPLFLDLAGSVEQACNHIASAGRAGVQLLVFPETWLPGYPVWLDVAPGAALWDSAPAGNIYRQLYQNSPTIDGAEVALLCRAAKSAGVMVVMGMNERSGRTLYNTILYISAEGEVIGTHRKLVPTYTERLLWGRGDGSTLNVLDTPFGAVGGLVCWEHWMPPARQALHEQNEVIHIAQWPTVKELHQIASRHYAFEGRCFVVAAGTVLQKQDLGHLDLALLNEIPGGDETFLMRGGSAIIAPDGSYVTEPLFDKTGLVMAELDLSRVIDGGLTLDVVGHYARPDIFTLHINTQKQRNTEWH